MSYIDSIRKNILYFLVSLPLSITLYEMFMMISTGSRSWIMLFAGQVVVVPFLAFIMQFIHAALLSIFGNDWGPTFATIFWLAICTLAIDLVRGYKVFDYGTPDIWKSTGGLNQGVPNLLNGATDGAKALVGFGILFLIVLLIVLPVAGTLYRIYYYNRSLWDSIRSSFSWANIFNSFASIWNALTNNGQIEDSDICSVIPGTGQIVSRLPSFYIAHITFICSYLFMTAYRLINKGTSENTDSRKMRLTMSAITLVIFLVSIIVLRYITSNCDSLLGIFTTTTLFAILGVAWYKFSQLCGCSDVDIYGIDLSKINAAPLVCSSRPPPAPTAQGGTS